MVNRMAFTPVDYIASYFGWNQFTPALPNFYWDVYSAEERVKKICFELDKLCNYANMLADNINIDHTLIQELQNALANIEHIDELNEKVIALQDTADDIQTLLESIPDYAEFVGLQEDVENVVENLGTKIPWPITPNPKYGIDGQVLRTNGDGTTLWQAPLIPTDTQAETYITQWLNEHPEATTTVEDGAITTAKLANGAVTDAKLAQTNGVLSRVNTLTENMNETFHYNSLNQYLFLENQYINNNGVHTTLNGYDTYRIPFKENDFIYITWGNLSEAPWGSLSIAYTFKFYMNDDTFIIWNGTSSPKGFVSASLKRMIAIAPINCKYFTITIKREYLTSITSAINYPYNTITGDNKVDILDTAIYINNVHFVQNEFYINADNDVAILNSTTAKTIALKLKQGTTLKFGPIKTGFSFRASLREFGSTESIIIGREQTPTFTYTTEHDCIIFVFVNLTEPFDTLIKTQESISVFSENVIGLENEYENKTCVAFGTSLTYRDIGYRLNLESISGMNIINEGISSGTIIDNILPAIKNYDGYANTRICLLEGFVNDWYTSKPLGNWNDISETTVCGCVRSAINYILTQNNNIKIFLILDHYGKSYSGSDCSTTAKINNITQFEYYNEIAKVAQSLGVKVIPEYELSGISELMPQYLADNIHLNALGGIQSANTIWNVIKNTPLNASQ